ncbi:MAG: glutamate--cysteine ligase, partial [Hyphomicrobium sp.]
MSTRQEGAPSSVVRSRDELAAWIAAGEKTESRWLIGTEHEKFVFRTDTLGPVAYEGPAGIRALMQAMIDRYGWLPIAEGDNIIALRRPDGESGGTISLEPGGQFELSGAPVHTLHETAAETEEHLNEVVDIGEDLGICFLGLGFSPKWTLAETPRMPKQRYGVMTRYMPQVGSRGLDMMYRTCTIQVNLDFADEADMVKKLRVSLALQPIATALFASSPFTECKPNGFKSMRSEVWRDTDKARTGMLPFVFEPGMGYERYVDYALDVPMYFVYRDGHYIDVAGASFRDFLGGKLAAMPGVLPTLDDWSDHLTTLFPEVRLKRFLEMRGADGGSWKRVSALSAFWVGLLYDRDALDAAYGMIESWTAEERAGLRNA